MNQTAPLVHYRDTADSIRAGLMEAAYNLGRMSALMESFHNCKNAHLRYPWPMEESCPGCRKYMDRFVEENHLELPQALLGWETMLYMLILDVERRTEKAKKVREQRESEQSTSSNDPGH